MDAPRGVILVLSGAAYAELLCVSVWTLRQHSRLPVAIFVTDESCRQAMLPLTQEPALAPLSLIDFELPKVRKHARYVVKPQIACDSPFAETLFLDADTLVVGDIEPLFGEPLTVTSFAGWNTSGRTIAGRVSQWLDKVSPVASELARRQLESPKPALNTGVFSFTREAYKALEAWRELTLQGWRCSFTDEISMQLLHEYAGARVLTDEFNCSPRFGKHKSDVRIWHLHGRGHVRKQEGAALWWPYLKSAMEEDIAGISQWAGQYDKAVATGLAQCSM